MKRALLPSLLIYAILAASCIQYVSPTRETETGSTTTSGIKEYRLDNGLRVLISEDHKAPVASFQIWYNTGSINETKGKTGLSHFLEHMMFKGTKKYGSKVFSNLIQKNGGIDNAGTTRDYTVYYQNLASDRIDLSIEMEADRMANLLLRQEDVDSEKKVVMEERRMRIEDDPEDFLFEQVESKAFTTHPYHNPVIGWMDDISALKREDLQGYYKTYYAPNNAVIIVAGDVNPDSVMKSITKHFGGIASFPIKAPSIEKEPDQYSQRRIEVKKQAQLPFVLIAYHVPSVPHNDSYALDVLSQIFSGKSGRLYQDIVKRDRLAIKAFADYSGLHKSPYLFFWGGTPKDVKDVKRFEEALLKEIADIASNPPSEREMQKAKNQIESTFVMGQDSLFFQGEVLGMFETIGGWRLKDKYLDGVAHVTADDIQAVAKKYFKPENSTVGVLIPED
ncbi:MAG: insulinase family protein [Candidatus Magnetominusculus sp. LBB02]|nr:insulinase family protein [Candidatus Magnetominusculus sp. LBB02]